MLDVETMTSNFGTQTDTDMQACIIQRVFFY